MANNDYETILSFKRSKYFWKFLNRQMRLQDLESVSGDSGYKLLLFSSTPDDMNDGINPNTGCLQSASGLTQITEGFTNVSFSLGIKWLDEGTNGFTLFLDSESDIDIEIDDDVALYVRGVMLVRENGYETGNNYVVAFARLSTRAECRNAITLLGGTEFVGHSSCKGGF